ncbi:MAG TPA: hypothetical protein PLR20_00250 [Syntrophales bacterium]|nr:hypothetical protein [Syntrophales bacterium]
MHRFANPGAGNDKTRGTAYDEKADRRSWEAMRNFLYDFLLKTPVKKAR